MTTIYDWLSRIKKQDGLNVSKNQLLQAIKVSAKNTFPVEYSKESGILV
jgi:hypothetical protein